MSTVNLRSIAVSSGILAACAAPALGQSLRGLGFLPGGTTSVASRVSRGGLVVVGTSGSTAGDRAFRWTAAGGMVDLGTIPGGTFSWGADVSDNGGTVVGTSDTPTGVRAFSWTSAGGMVDLGLPLDGGGDGAPTDSYANAVSGNGTAIAGFSAPQNDAFRRTVAGGMVSVGPFGSYSLAYDANRDGSVIVGNGTAGFGDHAFRWTITGGMEDLGTFVGGTHSYGWAVSDDGAVVVGHASMSGFSQVRAFRWTNTGGLTSLGTLPLKAYSRAYGVSGDGTKVVGVSGSPDRAILWTASLGMVDLNTYLPSVGIPVTGWTLTVANGISGDGSTIVGNGMHNGKSEGWVAVLPGRRHQGIQVGH